MMPNPFQAWYANQKFTRKFHPSWIPLVIIVTLSVAGIVWITTLSFEEIAEPSNRDGEGVRTITDTSHSASAVSPAPTSETPLNPNASSFPDKTTGGLRNAVFTPPDPQTIPEGEFGDAIRLGRNIFTDTQTYARAYVGNGLNCVNCHLDEGRKADSAPLWAAYGMYPAYRDKNHKVNSYEERLQGCFRFSMNGKAPAQGSKELIALTSYSFWLAKGAPTGVELAGRGYPKVADPLETPDPKRGQALFEAKCTICHGADGQGTQVKGRYVFPPLWGKNSFNSGAGMSKDHNAAGFIKANMPLGQGDTLSDQEAWDIAKYVNSHTRPPDPRTLGKR